MGLLTDTPMVQAKSKAIKTMVFISIYFYFFVIFIINLLFIIKIINIDKCLFNIHY